MHLMLPSLPGVLKRTMSTSISFTNIEPLELPAQGSCKKDRMLYWGIYSLLLPCPAIFTPQSKIGSLPAAALALVKDIWEMYNRTSSMPQNIVFCRLVQISSFTAATFTTMVQYCWYQMFRHQSDGHVTDCITNRGVTRSASSIAYSHYQSQPTYIER